MPNDAPAPHAAGPSLDEMLGLRPSVITGVIVRHLRARALVVGTILVALGYMMGAFFCLSWLIDPVLVLVAGALVGCSAHRRTYGLDPQPRVLPITPGERVRGIAAACARLWLVGVILPTLLLAPLALWYLEAFDRLPQTIPYIAHYKMTLFIRSVGLYLLFLYAALWSVRALKLATPARWHSGVLIVLYGVGAVWLGQFLFWMPWMGDARSGFHPHRDADQAAWGVTFGLPATILLLWLLARSAWISLEAAYADAE